MRALREAMVILVVGVVAGVCIGVVRGFPAVAQPEADAAACMAPVPDTPQIQWVTQEQAHQALNDGAAFVDARPRDAFVAGHIAGAMSVPMSDGTVPDSVVQMLRSAGTVVTYCNTADDCSRSTRLAGLLVGAGLQDVRVLEGGITGWLEREYPAEAGTCPLCP